MDEEKYPDFSHKYIVPKDVYAGKPGADVEKLLLKREVVDITDGFPCDSVAQLQETLMVFLDDNDIAKFPILAFNTDKGIRIFILTYPQRGRMNHLGLLEKLGKNVADVVFASGINGFTFEPKAITTEHYLGWEEDQFYLEIQDGSDAIDHKEFIVTRKKDYQQMLRKCFSKLGVIKDNF